MTTPSGLRVALVPSSYHPYFGGVEEHTRQVAAQLARRGMAVEVWTPDRGEHLGTRMVDGIRVRYLPTPLPARRLTTMLQLLRTGPVAASAWIRAARSFRPDLLHVQCFGPNGTYALALAALTRTPLMVSSHGETFADDHGVFDRSELQRRSLRSALRRSAAVTACSQVVADDLRDRFAADGVVVVPNGVELSEEDTGRLPRGRSEAEPAVILVAGRLVRTKGFDLLLRAVAEVRSPVRVVVVGDGPELSPLRDLAVELGLAGRVDFVGRTSSEEVRHMMRRSDLVAVPSRAEAFGIVVLEAWAAGTPVVATDRGGPACLVTDRVDGRLVDPDDTSALAQVIDEVLGDPGGAAGLARAGSRKVSGYTWQRVAGEYQGLYEISRHDARGVAPGR